MRGVTRMVALCLAALLAYGMVVRCHAPGWIGTPHRAYRVDEVGRDDEPTWMVFLMCPCSRPTRSVFWETCPP